MTLQVTYADAVLSKSSLRHQVKSIVRRDIVQASTIADIERTR